MPGSINVTFKTRIDGTVVATTQDTVVVFNTGMTNAATYGTVGTRVTTLAATSLFPFSSPDAVYAGSCAENNPDPDELGLPAVAGAKADISVISNQATPAEIQLPALDLTVRRGNSSGSPGSPLSDATVKVTDTQCSVSGTPVKRTYTTNSSGKLDTPGLPYGIYDICANRTGPTPQEHAHRRPGADDDDRYGQDDLPRQRRGRYLLGDMPMNARRPVSDERGITIIELLVGMVVGIVVLGGVVTLVTTTARSSGRISERVAVDQIARPMVQRIMDELHSTCVSPGVAPILAGSTEEAITFVHATGSDVSPTPVKRTISLSGGNPDRHHVRGDRR